MSKKSQLKQIETDREQFILIYRSRIGDYDRLIAELEKMNTSLIARIFCPKLRRRIDELGKEREAVLGFVQRQIQKFDDDMATVKAHYYFGEGGKFHTWFRAGRLSA